MDEQADVLALPGPADWTDGLVAFRRTFTHADAIGARRLRQTRSYFGVELPGDWWMFALDVPAGGVIDAHRRATLSTWRSTYVGGSGMYWRDGYRTIDLFIREVIKPTGARMALYLAGDDHHCARFVSRSEPVTHAITCGGGGAHPTATHTLPSHFELPPRVSYELRGSVSEQFDIAALYRPGLGPGRWPGHC